jgi:hypothetical protein
MFQKESPDRSTTVHRSISDAGTAEPNEPADRLKIDPIPVK